MTIGKMAEGSSAQARTVASGFAEDLAPKSQTGRASSAPSRNSIGAAQAQDAWTAGAAPQKHTGADNAIKSRPEESLKGAPEMSAKDAAALLKIVARCLEGMKISPNETPKDGMPPAPKGLALDGALANWLRTEAARLHAGTKPHNAPNAGKPAAQPRPAAPRERAHLHQTIELVPRATAKAETAPLPPGPPALAPKYTPTASPEAPPPAPPAPKTVAPKPHAKMPDPPFQI